MKEFIGGLIILIVPLLIVFILFFKWWKDYKRTRKLLVLYDKKTKYWFLVFIVLLAMFIFATFTDYSEPIQIKIEEWNPWGWYG